MVELLNDAISFGKFLMPELEKLITDLALPVCEDWESLWPFW
jgi:hypothetical protein